MLEYRWRARANSGDDNKRVSDYNTFIYTFAN